MSIFSVTWRYVIAVSLIAMLATASVLTFHFEAAKNETVAATLNTAGRQRMLSQRILRTIEFLSFDRESEQRVESLSRFGRSLLEFVRTHAQLKSGQLLDGRAINLSPEVQKILFEAPHHLDKKVGVFVSRITETLSAYSLNIPLKPALTDYLRGAETEELLLSLEAYVEQLQIDGELSVQFLRKLELGFYLLTLVVLVLEVLLIFSPMARRIQTQFKELEDAKTEVQERFSKIFESSPALVSISTSDDATILDVNQTWLKTLGYTRSEVLGQSPYKLDMFVDPDVRKLATQRLSNDLPVSVETQYRTKSGKIRDFLVSGEPVEFEGQDCYLFISQDITELRRIENEARLHRDELAHVTRVATLGEMATSLAHELNQPLAAISAYVDGSLRHLKSGSAASESIVDAMEKASEQAVRAGSIIRRLREFVSKNESRTEKVDFNQAVRTATTIVKSELNLSQVNLDLNLATENPVVVGDPVLIQQVILNILNNSIDALKLGRPEAGRITVTTEVSERTLAVSITDNGAGIDPKYMDQLFDPYFSTKDSGLGLGLPICRSIIEDMGGEIWCDSTSGTGTTFHIRTALI